LSQTENQKLVETGKILGGMYSSLIIFFAILFFLGFTFSPLADWVKERSFILIWTVGAFIIVIGTELSRVLFKSGVTIVGYLGLLALNLMMVVLGLAVYVDIIDLTTSPVTIPWIVLLVILSILWYIVLSLLMFRERRRR